MTDWYPSYDPFKSGQLAKQCKYLHPGFYPRGHIRDYSSARMVANKFNRAKRTMVMQMCLFYSVILRLAFLWGCSFAAAAAPLTAAPYFGAHFYGSNGVCLSLHIHDPYARVSAHSFINFYSIVSCSYFIAFNSIWFCLYRMRGEMWRS